MSSSNYRRNEAAIKQFRKELMDMLDDIGKIDVEVLNQAVNEGVAFAKRHTPVGEHPNPVTFTVKRGPDAGKIVSFEIRKSAEASACAMVGGWLRWNWHKLPTKKSGNGIEAEMVNNAEYASYWNYGHRIVTKKGGPTKGFVKGTYILEKAGNHVQKRMVTLFNRKVEEVQRKHDK